MDVAQFRSSLPILNAVRNAPVLTIGNGAGFTDLGGMFELVVHDRRVQFDVNIPAIRGAQLDVSARLLQLARNIRDEKGGS